MKINLDKKYTGRHVIIRTNNAGVWFGVVQQVDKEIVVLDKARRMYEWKCADDGITLSHIALKGINGDESSIQAPIDDVLLQWIEVLPCSLESVTTFNAQPYAKAI